MESVVADPELNDAFDQVDAALDRLDEVGVAPVDGRDVYGIARRIESVANRVYGHQVALVVDIDRRALFAEDGHRNGKAMVTAAANLSGSAAFRRAQTARALPHLPIVAEGLMSGRLGIAQADRIARTFANPRVRQQLIEVEADMATVAELLPYPEFEAHLIDWERLADEDGAADRAERTHANRNFRIHVNVDGSVRVEGGCGGVQGLILKEVFDRYVEDEWQADWTEARTQVGDAATLDDLPRTDKQRRMDAVSAIFADAIAHKSGASSADGRGPQLVVNLVVDDTTYERGVDRLCGKRLDPDPRLGSWWGDLADSLGPEGGEPAGDATEPERDRPVSPQPASSGEQQREAAPDPGAGAGGIGYRCGTVDGHPLDPREVVAASLIGHVRRVVMGADSVVLDMGRRQRLFTGARQVAVRLSGTRCPWPGCHVPSSQCQSDHLEEFNGPGKGRTSPENGAPACGMHNRHKTAAGFTLVRDRWGRFHIIRPDGVALT